MICVNGIIEPNRINRTILECKEILIVVSIWIYFVLIEPYWNVKVIRHIIAAILLRVLIEPYWNVKRDFGIVLLRSVHRINRTILECKAKQSDICKAVNLCINRTILECKA